MSNNYIDLPILGSSGSGGGGGSGTVTSVGLSLTGPIYTVTGSPVTTSGTLTGTIANQAANSFLSGPTSGAAAAPTFRAPSSADIPAINLTVSGNGGVSGTLPAGNITPINLASNANGGVTGILASTAVGQINLAVSGNGGVTGTLPAGNITPINLASNANGGVTGVLSSTAVGQINLAASGNGGVTGTLPAGNITPINLASNANGGVSGILPSTAVGQINLAVSGNGGVTGTLPAGNITPINLASNANGGVTGILASTAVGQINLAVSGNGGVTGTVPIGNGGTNVTTYTTGDLLYASNTNVLSKLGIGSGTQVLKMLGGVPNWGAFLYNTASKSAGYTASSSDNYIVANSSTPFTITLPSSTGITGTPIFIQKSDSSTGILTISGTMLGTASSTGTTLNTQWESLTLLANASSGYMVLNRSYPESWTSFTPTGTFTTNSTYTGIYQRVGNICYCKVKILFSGAPNAATLNINTPFSIDTAKLNSTIQFAQSMGNGIGYVSVGPVAYNLEMSYGSQTSISPLYQNNVSGAMGTVSNTTPATWAVNDEINVWFDFPVLGWNG